MKSTLATWVSRLFKVAAERTIRRHMDDVRIDAIAMQQLALCSPVYFPWTKPALRPRSVVTILNDIIINERTCIVELGGGVSTYYIAQLLASRTGHLFTVEHDQKWMSTLSDFLRKQGLEQQVTFIHAPLIPSPFSANKGLWYDSQPVAQALEDRQVDMLIVDGPPSQTEDKAVRFGAVPFFAERMSEHSTILLDDASRAGEREVVRRWEHEYGMRFNMQGDLAISTRGRAYIPYL